MKPLKILKKSEALRAMEDKCIQLEIQQEHIRRNVCTHDIVILSRIENDFFATCIFCEFTPPSTDYFYYDRMQRGLEVEKGTFMPAYIFDCIHDEDKMLIEAQKLYKQIFSKEKDMSASEIAHLIEKNIQQKHCYGDIE